MADSSNNQSYSLISVEKAKKRSFEDPMPASVGIDTSAVASSSEKENSVSRASQSSAELTSPDAQEVSEPLDVQEASKPRAAQKPSNSPEAKKIRFFGRERARQFNGRRFARKCSFREYA